MGRYFNCEPTWRLGFRCRPWRWCAALAIAAAVAAAAASVQAQSVPPTILAQPQSVTNVVGSDVSFSVNAAGTPPLRYQWLINTTNVPPNATNATLNLTAVQVSDAGTYAVIVANSFGSAFSKSASLTVRSPPAIVQQPASLTVTQGNVATFSVVARSDGSLSYQWFFNDTNAIPGATGPTYTIAAAQPSQAGRYSVRVTSELGSAASEAAVLIVRAPPSITQPPAGAIVPAGSNLVLRVTVAGDPPLTYQWFVNGTNVLAGQTNDTLNLLNAQPADSGAYSVFVANDYGSAVSSPGSVIVQVRPAIVQGPASLITTQGFPAAFSVVATGDSLSYQWLFNATNVVSLATNRVLTLQNVQPSQVGTYSVAVSNLVGFARSGEATLTLRLPPSITRHPTSVVATQGQTVSFSVLATGDPTLAYQWRWNATNLPGQNDAILTLGNATMTASGNYDVVVQNPYGSLTSRVATLTVLGLDFGDAPEPTYPTLQASDGARHLVLPGVHLGSSVTISADGQPDAGAAGDLNDAGNEEDGVTFLTPLRSGQPATVQVVASTNGLLNAWIDFDQAGGWRQAQEQIFTNRALLPGTNLLTFGVSPRAVPGQTFARFRFSTAADLSFTGQAPDGEVEDYLVSVAPAADLAVGATSSTSRIATGNNAVYTISVTNRGPVGASGVRLTNFLSTRSAFVSVTSSQGACSPNGGLVTCDLGDLASGARATITLTARIGQGTNTTLSTVSAAEFDSDAANNSSTASVLGTSAPVFANGDTIVLPLLDPGPGSVYPATLSVAGITSAVLKATVTLRNLNHDYPDDIDILLVGPRGQKTYLMSDCGLDNALVDVSITLDDEATSPLPDTDPPIVDGGTYRPSNYGSTSDDFAAPAPPPPYATNLAIFRNTDPNGVWSLYMMDDQPENAGPNSTEGFLADGWTLTLLLGDPLADLGIKQNGPAGPVLVGDHIVYSIAVTNAGPAASAVLVRDALPAGMALANVTPSRGTCANSAGTVICDLGSLASGGAATISLDLIPGLGGTLTNIVTVSGPQLDLNPSNNTAAVVTRVLPMADLEVRLSAGAASLLLGQSQNSLVLVTNHGPNAASSVSLTNVLPLLSTVVSAVPSQGACTNLAGTLICSLGSLSPGAGASLQLAIQPGLSGTNGMVAAVSANELDPLSTNNSASIQFAVLPAADLALKATPGQATLLLGQPAVLAVSVTNRGPSSAEVTVTNQLPNGFSVASALASRGSCAPSAAGLACALGPLAPGESATILINANPPAAGTFTNLISLSSSVIDPTLADLFATNIITFIPAADIAVEIVDQPHPVWLGDDLNYFITVTNRGPLSVARVAFTNQLPAGVSILASGNTRGSCFRSGTELDCDFGGLAPGEGGLVTVQLHPGALGSLVTRASAVSELPDPFPANNLATQTTRVVGVSSINNSTNRFDIPNRGLANPYPSTIFVSGLTAAVAAVRVTLTNLSHTYADDLDVLLVGPNGRGVELMSDAGGEFGLNQVTLTFDDYAPPLPDETAIQSGFARPTNYGLEPDLFPAPAPQGPYATNLAVFTGIDPNGPWSLYIVDDADKDAGTLDGWGLTLSTVDPIADLVLVQSVSANPATVGSPVTFSYAVTNRGPAVATDSRLTNSLPHGLQGVTVTASSASCSLVGDLVSCALGNLSAGGGAIVTVVGIPGAPANGSNLVAVGSRLLDIHPSNNAVATLVPFDLLPAITLDPLSQSVTNGDPVLFVGGALGSEPLSYQWLRNEADVPGATNPILSIAYAVPALSGSYRLRVSNPVGTALSRPATLQVFGPPTISDLPPLAIDEDTTTPALPFTVFDFESPPEALLLAGESSDHSLVLPSGILFQGAGTNRTVRITPLPNATGTVTIFILAQDTDGGVSTNSFVLTIRPVNDPPVLSRIPNQATEEDTALSVPFTVTDVESAPDDLVYSVISSNSILMPPGNVTFSGNGTNRLATFLPALNESGTTFITLTVTDPQGASASTGFLLSVAAVNDPPTLDPIPDLTIAEDTGPQSLPLTGITTGAPNEAQHLSVFARSSNPAIIPDPTVIYSSPGATGTLVFLPLPDASGPALITVTVKDGQATNGTFSRSFTVNVTPVNDPPSFAHLPDQVTDEDIPLSLPIALRDLETPPGDLSIVASSSDTNLVADTGFIFGGAGANRTLMILPATNRSGTATVTLTVTDSGGATFSDSFALTIRPVNDPPTLDPIPDLTVPEGSSTQIINLTGISAGAPDESEPVAVTVTSSNPSLLPDPVFAYTTPNATGTLTFRPTANASGIATIVLVLDDGQAQNHETVRSFTVTVNATNDAPILSGLSDQTTDEDTPLVVPFTVSDAEGSVFLVTLTASSTNSSLVAPTNILLSGSGVNRGATISPRPNQFGTTLITIFASDGQRTGSNSFRLTVVPVNDPPTLNPLTNVNLTVSPGLVSIPLSGITPGAPNETQTLTVTASNSNPTLFLSAPSVSYPGTGTNATLTFRPANNTVGAATIAVTVNDGSSSNNTFSRAFILNIRSTANTQPVLSAIANQTTPEDTPTAAIPFTVRDAETVATNLTVFGTSSNPTLLPNANIVINGVGTNRTITLIPAADQFGTALVTLTAFDAAFGASDRSFTLTVTSVNDPPILAPLPNVSTAEDVPTEILPVVINDVDTPVASLSVSAVSSNPVLLPTTNILIGGSGFTRGLILVPAPDQSGTATVTVRVSDGAASNSTSFVLTVNSTNDPPQISALGDVVISEDTSSADIAFTIRDSETDADALTLTALSSSPSLVDSAHIVLSGSGTNRTVTLTPTPDQSGTALITISVTDGDGATANRSFLLRVDPVNDPPTLAPLPDLLLNPNAEIQSIPLSGIGTGAPDERQALAVTAETSDLNLITALTVNYNSGETVGSLNFRPVPNRSGLATIRVTVNDGAASNNLTTRSFSVILNAAPLLSDIPDQITLEDTPLGPVLFSVLDDDTPASLLTVTATSSNPDLLPSAGLVLQGTEADRALMLFPATNLSGTATITLTVTDTNGAASTNSFELTVVPVPDPILVTAQPQNTTALVGQAVTLQILASSALPISYQWLRNGLPVSGATGPSLTLPNLQLADSATYHVAVSNADVVIVSADAVVQVVTQPPVPTILGLDWASSAVTVTFATAVGPTYHLEYKNFLADPSWTLLGSQAGNGLPRSLVDTNPAAASRYYRVRVD